MFDVRAATRSLLQARRAREAAYQHSVSSRFQPPQQSQWRFPASRVTSWPFNLPTEGPHRRRSPPSRRAQGTSGYWRNWNQDLPEHTPDGFHHYLYDRHPLAQFARPRPRRYAGITSECVTSELPQDTYRHVPTSGYQSFRFFKSLFPHNIKDMPSPSNKILVMELQCLDSAVAFRDASQALLNSALNGSYVEEVVSNPRTAFNSHSSTLAPPKFHDITPVLYQIVATGYPTGVVLEAKDFFVMCPDRRDLHCIVLDHHSINIVSSCRGFNKTILSVKDLVWVYRVTPSWSALRDPAHILERSRIASRGRLRSIMPSRSSGE